MDYAYKIGSLLHIFCNLVCLCHKFAIRYWINYSLDILAHCLVLFTFYPNAASPHFASHLGQLSEAESVSRRTSEEKKKVEEDLLQRETKHKTQSQGIAKTSEILPPSKVPRAMLPVDQFNTPLPHFLTTS